jgi:hypothetical protein
MKEATESEYAISQKLTYETAARQGLEVEFDVVLSHCKVTKSPLQGMRWS